MNTQRMPLPYSRNLAPAPMLAGGLALTIFLVDTYTHINHATTVLHSLAIMLAASLLARQGASVVAMICVVSVVVGYVGTHLDERYFPPLARSIAASFTIVAAAILALRIQADSLRLAQQARETKIANDAIDRLTAELAHATRVTLLGEMAASIAHEVTQPISAIAAHGDAGLRWLKRDAPNLDEACNAIESMVRCTRRANEIVGRIRALARKSEITFAPLNVNHLVIETMDVLDPELRKYGAIARLHLAPGELTINGDRVQLQQILINLAVNGLHAMSSIRDRPRVLEIHTQTHEDASVVLIVDDTGTGIAAELETVLFRPFHTTKADGIGLGLSICRSIAEGHGGSITCASSSSGTRMVVRLPPCAPRHEQSTLAYRVAPPNRQAHAALD